MVIREKKRIFFHGMTDALFYTLCVLSVFESLFYNVTLNNFQSRVISSATLSGISVSARVNFYYEAMLVAIVSFLFFNWVLKFRFNYLHRVSADVNLKTENDFIFVLSAVGIINWIAQILGSHSEGTIKFIICLQITVYFLQTARILAHRYHKNAIWVILHYKKYVSFIFLYSFSMMFNIVYVGKLIKFSLIEHLEVSFVLSFLLTLLMLYFTIKTLLRDKIETQGKYPDVWLTFAPTFISPFFIPFSNELYLILAGHSFFVRPLNIWIFTFTLLIIIQIIMYLYIKKRNVELKIPSIFQKKVLVHFYYPSLLVILCSIAFQPSMHMGPPNELFESGNSGVAIQQLFNFGKIPILETFNAHGISELFSPIVFSLINGHQGWADNLYQDFIMNCINYIIAYYFLRKFTSEHFTFIFLLFFPFYDFILPSYVSFSLIAAITLEYLLKTPNFKRHIIFWFILSLTFLWRFDLGFAAVISSVLVYFSYFMVYKFRIPIKNFILSACLVFFSWFTLFVVLAISKHVPVLFRLKELEAVLQSNQVWGYPTLGDSSQIKYYFFYILFPLSELAILVSLFIKIKVSKKITREAFVAFLFIVFYTIFNFPRGLVRHSLVEGITIIVGFLGFSLSFLPYIFGQYHSRRKFSKNYFFLTVTIGTLYSVLINVGINGSLMNTSSIFLQTADKYQSFQNYSFQDTKIVRYEESEAFRKNTYNDLKHLFDSTLKSNETFIDFSDSPYLYALTGRTTPMYINQTPAFLSDEVTQKSFLDEISHYSVPYVVYPDKKGWPTLDAVPNYIRSYRVSEYIYHNYEPFIEVDGYGVWVLKDRKNEFLDKLSRLNKKTNDEEVVQGSSLNHVWFNDVLQHNVSKFGLNVLTGGNDPQLANILTTDNIAPLILQPDYRYYVEVSYSSLCGGDMQLFYKANDNQYTENNSSHFTASVGKNRIATFEINPSGTLSDLRVDPPNNDKFTLQYIKVYKMANTSIKFLPYDGPGFENDALGWIPYYWGEKDPLQAVKKAQIQKDLSSKDNLSSGEAKTYYLSGAINNSKGNYVYLRIQTPKTSGSNIISLEYGDQSRKLGSLSFNLKTDGKMHNYLIRISSQYNWNINRIQYIKIYTPKKISIERLSILDGD